MIQRPVFSYHSLGHPLLSHRRINAYSEYLLGSLFPENLQQPKALNGHQILQLLKDHDGVSVDFSDLGNDNGRKRLGRLYFNKKLIVLDSCLTHERMISLPFVAAHEAAHWLLHRDCNMGLLKRPEALFEDDEATEEKVPRSFYRSPLDWIEWQANALAGALLIPQITAQLCILNIHDREFPTNRQKGIIYKNLTLSGGAEAEMQLGLVARAFRVSKTVARIRLKKIGLYEEQVPPKSVQISDGISRYAH